MDNPETKATLDTRKVILYIYKAIVHVVPTMYLHDVLLVNCQFVLVKNITEILLTRC